MLYLGAGMVFTWLMTNKGHYVEECLETAWGQVKKYVEKKCKLIKIYSLTGMREFHIFREETKLCWKFQVWIFVNQINPNEMRRPRNSVVVLVTFRLIKN